MTNTLNTTGLGTVKSEKVNMDSGLFKMPLPTSISADLIALDLFGATRTIDIDGVYTSTDGSINTFMIFLNGLINGQQQVLPYISEIFNPTTGPTIGYYNVLIQTVDWSRNEGEVNQINYSISMLEASA